MLRTGQSPAPSQGRSSSASTPGSRPTPGVLLPGTLASPRTGLAPAGCRELVARLRPGALLPVVLGARAAGRTFLRINKAAILRETLLRRSESTGHDSPLEDLGHLMRRGNPVRRGRVRVQKGGSGRPLPGTTAVERPSPPIQAPRS